MDNASPPVSPTVVAQILTTQNARVTSGTLLGLDVSAGLEMLTVPVRARQDLDPSPRSRRVRTSNPAEEAAILLAMGTAPPRELLPLAAIARVTAEQFLRRPRRGDGPSGADELAGEIELALLTAVRAERRDSAAACARRA